jgi:hypothetical protein
MPHKRRRSPLLDVIADLLEPPSGRDHFPRWAVEIIKRQ